jgi:branched-chain amino acid transport system substrate-binding protein
MNMRRRAATLPLLGLLKVLGLPGLPGLLLLGGCDEQPAARRRAERLAAPQAELLVAVAWPLNSSKAAMVDGVRLAQEEINAAGGVLGGRKIRLLVKDDASSLSTGRQVAQEIADNLDVAAVIGHLNTYVAAPASQIYERAGLLMITPGASGQKVTEQGGRLVFRSLPNNRDQARQIGDYALAQGYKRVAIYYIKNDYGNDLANCFEQRAHELGIVVADRRSYSMEANEHRTLMADWSTLLKTDAIFLIGSMPDSPVIIREARAAGLRVPVFGGAGLDSQELIARGGRDIEGTVIFSLFSADDPSPQARAFAARYRRRYGTLPDSSAAQGYDAMQLLAHAVRQANSAVPEQIAAALRATRGWQGATGSHVYNDKGDPVAKRLAKVVVRNGRFEYFDAAPPAAPAWSALP